MNYCPTNANRLRRKGVAACVAFLTLLVPAFASVHAAGNPASPAADSVRRQPAAAKTTVKGYVFDESNQPLFGATVTEEGTTNAVAVDKNGSYQIQVTPREGLKLTYRFLGMEPQTVEVGRRSTIDVVLKSDAVKISDVVVTGYGNILREAYTGSASILSSNDISRRAAGSFESLLGGLVPGLLSSGSGQPGDAAELRLRGFGSIGSGGQPLYVVDGVVFDQDNTSGHSGAVASPMATLNPSDIASITILKDAASASLYGSQGANGVIVITTKQGVPSDRVRYTLSVQAGFSRIAPSVRPDLVDSEQYKELWTEGQFHRLVQQAGGSFVENLNGLYNNKLGFTVDGRNYYQWYKQAQQDFNNYYAVPRPDGSYYNYDFWGADAGKLPSVDWYDKILRNASFQQYDLSLSGGSSTLKYYMSVGYLNQQGIIINSDLQRYSARVSVSADDRKKRINWGASANISRTEQSGPLTSGSNYNMPHYAALLLPSVVPAYLEDGSYNFRFPNNLLNGNHNPIASARDNIRKRPQFNLFVSAWVRLNITDWLDFRSDISQYYITGRRSDYFDRDFGTGYLVGGELTDYDSKRLKTTNKNMLNFNYTLNGRHRFSATAGLELVDFRQEWNSVTAVNFLNDLRPVLSSAAEISGWNGSGYDYSQVSIVTRADYSYRYRYFIGGSFRQDRSSRFSPEHRTGNFWSVSAAYRITNENWAWLDPVKRIFNNIKFKASYGYNGNLPSKYYNWRTLYNGSGRYDSGHALSQTFRATYDLSWEKNNVFNVGVDLGMFRDRIRISAEYYSRKSTDLLQEVPVSQVSGYSTMLMNTSAGIRNRGFELDLDAHILNKLFKWDLKLNMATLSAKYFGLEQDIIGSNAQIMRNGQSVGAWYLNKFAGIDSNTGQVLYYGVDEYGNDIISNSDNPSFRRIVGKGVPTVSGGFNTLFSYRGWDLSALFTYAWGHDVYDSRAAGRTGIDGQSMDYNIDTRQLDRWTPDNRYASNRIRINGQTSAGSSTRYLYKGDYLKMKNVRLQYTFPASTFRKLRMTGFTLFVQAENLWVWTEAQGYDPDLQIDGYIATAKYPSAMTFTAGLNFNF